MLYENYIYGLPGHFTDEECNTIIEIANNNKIVEGQVGPQTDAKKNEGKTVDAIRSSSIVWITQEMLPASIENKIHNAMNQALKETNWNFDISYRQAYQYTIYNAPETTKKSKGDFYTWHTDAGPEVNKDNQLRKLSFTLQLSHPDEYEGGYFQWLEPQRCFDHMQDNATIDMTNGIKTLPYSVKDKGSIFFFPSFVHHQVTPVTRGQRKSFVGWCVGNQYV
jgi:PKHD-type hydroxylase